MDVPRIHVDRADGGHCRWDDLADGWDRRVARNRVAATVNDLVSTLALARVDALKKHHPIVVCASADGTTCKWTNDWNNGWIAALDTTEYGDFTLSGASFRTIRSHPPVTGVQVYLQMNGKFTGFNGFGFPLSTGRVLVSETRGSDPQTVCVTLSGEVYAVSGSGFCR